MKQLTVFIAGSTVLSNEFNAVKSALVHVNNAYSGEIYINPYTFEDYDGPFSLEGDQEKYNYLIREVADYVIFILDGDIGGITREEFDVAWNSYVSQGRPGIYVYHKPTDTISNETKEVIDKVKNCKQYYKKYTDLENLSLKVQLHFTNQVKKILYDRPNNLLTAKVADLEHTISQSVQKTADINKLVYKVRVNRPCRLLIDDKEVAILEEQKLTDIPVSAGVHLRKVIAIDDDTLFDEAKIDISNKQDLDIVILDTAGLDKAKRKALPQIPFQVDDLWYEALENQDGVMVVKGVDLKITKIQIPEEITYANFKYKVKAINDNAFNGCGELKSITIPRSITSIGSWAFSDCSALSSITIPSSIVSIGNYAFFSCTQLSSINIPDSVTNIGEGAFINCSSLRSIVIDKDNCIYDSRDKCNAIIETSTNTLILGCVNTYIPCTVEKIGNNAFFHCKDLTSISIPNSVTSIGNGAFSGCTSLILITIPDSVSSIGKGAFTDCYALISITIPDSVTKIENGMFCECKSLTDITLHNNITDIEEYAFSGCEKLEDITIPSGVTTIKEGVFSLCHCLTSVIIPDNVTCIGKEAFGHCRNLISITIPNSVTSIENCALIFCTKLQKIYIPKGTRERMAAMEGLQGREHLLVEVE